MHSLTLLTWAPAGPDSHQILSCSRSWLHPSASSSTRPSERFLTQPPGQGPAHVGTRPAGSRPPEHGHSRLGASAQWRHRQRCGPGCPCCLGERSRLGGRVAQAPADRRTSSPVEVQPACVNCWCRPSFQPRCPTPAFKLPQPFAAVHDCVAQFPAVKLMASEHLTAAGHQTVAEGSGLAIAQLQRTAPGAERQQACHGVGLTQGILKHLAKQQQAAALGVDRQAGGGGPPQVALAALADGQLSGMQLRVTPGRITPGTPGAGADRPVVARAERSHPEP